MEPTTQTQGSGNGNGVVIGMTMPPDPEWSPEVVEIGESIVNLTIAQCAQLSIYLDEVHGIKCSNGVPEPKQEIHGPDPNAVPEQTEFAVILDGYDADKKIGLIKTYRELTSLGLKEAKDFIENGAGKPIKEGLAHGEAIILKTKLEAAGARCSVK